MTGRRRAAELSAWCRKISIHLEHSQGAVREPRLVGAKDIEVLDLLGLKGFPFRPGPIERVDEYMMSKRKTYGTRDNQTSDF